MTRVFHAPLVALMLDVLVGCASKECTEIGCQSSLTLTIQAPQGTKLTAGTYTVRVDADTETVEITCPIGGNSTSACCDDGKVIPEIELCAVATGTGSAVAPDQIRVTFRGDPKTVSVRVERDGGELTAHTVTPSYEPRYANGPDCGVTCRIGTAELQL